jgi:peptide chain release factor 2
VNCWQNCRSYGAGWRKCGIVFDIDDRRSRIAELENQTQSAEVWADPEKAAELGRRLARLREAVEPWEKLRRRVEDLEVLAQLAAEEDDAQAAAEVEAELAEVKKALAGLEVEALYTGPMDEGNAILTITAGAGGTDACDWAEMLLRMYRLWAEHRGLEFSVISFVEGDGAGFRNVTARVAGPFAYGRLKAEDGVHRLVRLSPFDAAHRRHTSFAAVEVLPEVSEDIQVEIREEDLRIDTFRSSGAGGQHVNKTDSAVRITHLPTGIVVQCQNERSQHANRRTAMAVLRSRLYDLERRRKQAERAKLRGERGEISFANQIRSYVLHPYTMVKDHRTGLQTGDVQAVLNGELDEFIVAWLQQQAARAGDEAAE